MSWILSLLRSPLPDTEETDWELHLQRERMDSVDASLRLLQKRMDVIQQR